MLVPADCNYKEVLDDHNCTTCYTHTTVNLLFGYKDMIPTGNQCRPCTVHTIIYNYFEGCGRVQQHKETGVRTKYKIFLGFRAWATIKILHKLGNLCSTTKGL